MAKKKNVSIEPYTMALLWTCTSCGFVKEGGQPHMECPSCGAYKTAFIDIPQHLEVEIRSALKKGVSPNSAQARQQRLALMTEHNVFENFRVKGRFLP
ncbi:MAG: rubredoxin-like domain-containing protein [Myxococcota bacterium]